VTNSSGGGRDREKCRAHGLDRPHRLRPLPWTRQNVCGILSRMPGRVFMELSEIANDNHGDITTDDTRARGNRADQSLADGQREVLERSSRGVKCPSSAVDRASGSTSSGRDLLPDFRSWGSRHCRESPRRPNGRATRSEPASDRRRTDNALEQRSHEGDHEPRLGRINSEALVAH
jgi:hypothetical protein